MKKLVIFTIMLMATISYAQEFKLSPYSQYLVENPSDFDPRSYLGAARQAILDMTAHKMRDVLNSANRI